MKSHHWWHQQTDLDSFQLEDFLKGYEEQEASVWIDLGCEGEYVLKLYLEMRLSKPYGLF